MFVGEPAVMDPNATLKLLEHLHICSPILLFSLFTVASFASNSGSEKKTKKHDQSCMGSGVRTSQQELSRSVKRLFSWLSVVMFVTYLADALLHLSATAIKPEKWWHEQSVTIHTIGSFFFYTTVLLALFKNDTSPTIALFISWSAAVPIELAISKASSSILSSVNQDSTIETLEGGQFWRSIVSRKSIELTFNGVRIATLLALVALYASKCTLKTRDHMGGQLVNSTAVATGPLALPYSKSDQSHKTTDDDLGVGIVEPQDTSGRLGGASSDSWWRYLKGYSIFFSYMWPSKSRRLQVILLVCLCLTISQLVVNALVPFQTGVIAIKFFTSSDITWFEIFMYVGYMWLQGGDGLLCSLRSIIWDSVSQNSSMELSVAAFKHVHSLSLDFHLGKRNGEILSSLSNGKSVTIFLALVTFQVVPAIFDFGIAVACLWIYYDAYSALALSILVFGYLYMTAHLVQRGSGIRRRMVRASSEENAVKNDSLMSYETVKYFTAEDYEIDRYRSSVEEVQNAEYQFSLFLELLRTSQNTLFMICILIMCSIAAYKKSTGHHYAGEFTYMTAYMSQLRSSLKFLAGSSQPIQSTLINSERMLELFQKQPTVVDSPHATPLTSYEGKISFENVTFSYDERKPALNGLTFNCQAGTTTALVGESGGGKSTVFRLLFRFYNPDQGYLRVDGHDVRSVTIDSLRRNIGVVPQDTVLFNETLMYNLKYANQDATEEQIHDACRAASIHDKIMAFPDGYNTKVGERGLRLSGGEKQRVAIARTILKNPKVILLDEATASLDTDTEEHIQRSLATLSHGRTMLVIAHRLSTITEADCILVLHEGQVVESGTHKELLDMKGRYAGMWKKQTRQEA